MEICGLTLPDLLVDLVQAERWRPPERAVLVRLWRQHFVSQPSLDSTFYDFATMERETRWCFRMEKLENGVWRRLPGIPAENPHIDFILGRKDAEVQPGRIGSSSALLIGDVDPDWPFALYYESDGAEPSVIAPNDDHAWVRVSDDFASFVTELEL